MASDDIISSLHALAMSNTEHAKWVSLKPNAKHADGVSLKTKSLKTQTSPETPRFLHRLPISKRTVRQMTDITAKEACTQCSSCPPTPILTVTYP